MNLPAFFDQLRADVERADPRFQWIDPADRQAITEALAGAFDENPFSEDFQTQGAARIRRSIPLFRGPARPVRLTQLTRPSTLLFDPEMPGKLLLALGANLPPQLWPEADASAEGLRRDLAPYLDRPFRSAHRMDRCVRVVCGTLDDLGLDSIDTLARIIANSEGWTDGAATWSNASIEDPWPDDPASASMITLHLARERAAEEFSNRRRAISMRTLWSRSQLKIEANPFGYIVFELHYDEAPALSSWPIPAEGIPDKIPADLLGSILRPSKVLKGQLDQLRQGPISIDLCLMACLLEPAETATFDLLRAMLREPGLLDPAVSLASAFGARALLYELECETDDEQLRAGLAEMNTLQPVSGSDDDSDGSDDDSDDSDDDSDEQEAE